MNFAFKRCVDTLGRIVLPKDMRDHYDIKSGDALEIIATEDGLFLKKASEEKVERRNSEILNR